jgi:hemolysin activation/secretion protein
MNRFCMMVLCLLLVMGWTSSHAEKSKVKTFTVNKIKLKGVKKHPDQNITRRTLEDKLNIWREESYPQKKLSLDQLKDLAYKVSKFYQDLGYSFVTASVPKQKIRRGVVVIHVKEDKLSDVSVRNVDYAQQKDIAYEFKGMIGHAVFKPNLEEPILLLNDNPNREVFAYFSRGKRKGETRLNLNVTETQSNDLSLGVDNFGSQATGKDQWWLAANIKNPFGWNDAINLNFNQAFENDKNISGTLAYEKFSGTRDSYRYSLSRNEYQLGDDLAVLGLEGFYTTARFQYKHKSKRTFSDSNNHIYSLDYRKSELSSDKFITSFDQTSSALLASYQYASTGYQLLLGDYLTKSLQVSGIFLTEKDEQLSDEAFIKFNGFIQSGINIGDFIPSSYSRITSNLALQYSPQTLPSVDKSSLTGKSGVRAFESGVFSADDSAIFQIKWSSAFNTTIGNIEPFIFYDHGYGVRNVDTESIIAELSGYGAGFNYKLSKWLQLSAMQGVSQKTKTGDLDRDSQSLTLFSLETRVF